MHQLSTFTYPVYVEAPLRVLVVADAADLPLYPTGERQRITASTARDAIRAIERDRPAVVVIDWDLADVDGAKVCEAALRFPISILATLAAPTDAPAALKAGCHAILLKPFPPNLAAARLGRLARQLRPGSMAGPVERRPRGTTRRCDALACPQCSSQGAISFEFAAPRRMWYACLACNQVWLDAALD